MNTPTSSFPTYRLRDIFASEWVKLTSVRSLRWTLAAFAVVSIGLGIAVSASDAARGAQHVGSGFDSTNQSLAGLAFGQLAMGVLGVLVITGEYSSGAIKSTLAVVPRRPLLLAAKALVYGAVALVTSELITIVMFFAGQAAMGGIPHASITEPGVARAVLLSGAFLPLVGLFALGIGTAVRHSAAGIGIFTALVLVLPVALAPFGTRVQAFAPESILSSSVASTVPQAGQLSPWVGFAVMAAYAALALAVGLVVLLRRDA